MRPLLLPVLLTLLAVGCDNSGPEPPPRPPPSPTGDEVVAGVNLTQLFAPPTRDEQDDVRALRQTRAADRADRYAYAPVATGTAADGASLTVFAGRLVEEEGAPVAHHVLLRLPPREPGDVRPVPLALISPRRPAASEADFLLDPDTELALSTGVAQALITLHGGTLRALGQTFSPGVLESPYDADAEGALAALDALLAPGVLPSVVGTDRIVWAGFGRGGTVALLAAAQDGRVDAVVSWAAPTSFFLPSVAADVERTLRGGDASDLPAFDPLYRNAIFPIRGDSTLLEEARRELLLRSPFYVADRLPPTLLIHSPQDRTVPFEHGELLRRELTPTPPFNLALFDFPGQEIIPGHDATFESLPARQASAQFLTFYLGL